MATPQLPSELRTILEIGGVVKPAAFPTMRRLEEVFAAWGLTYTVNPSPNDLFLVADVMDKKRSERYTANGIGAEIALTIALSHWILERRKEQDAEAGVQLTLPGGDDDAGE